MSELWLKLSKMEMRNLLALVALIGCMSLVGVMQVYPVPEANREIFHTAIGFLLGSCLGPVFQYFFGSSKIDADKNKKEN